MEDSGTIYSYKTADALLEAIQETGVSYLFSNLGSDHPSIIEALAKAKQENKEIPKVIICPHESVAFAAAQGAAMITGQAQGVVVHTDVGTQNLGGSVHNAFRARVPVFIFAGETPYSMAGELRGSRNSYVNYMQNIYDQNGILRHYLKWDGSIRTGKNVKQLVYRAMQMAHSAPAGPVYLTAAREALEEDIPVDEANTYRNWNTIQPNALAQHDVHEIIHAIQQSKQPLIITSYLGRNTKAVSELVEFCEQLAIPVIEQQPSDMNFPRNHRLHLGYDSKPFVQEADLILALDTDVPWVYSQVHPMENCKVYYLDEDPIKEDIPLWHIPTMKNFRVDSYTTLKQFNDYLLENKVKDPQIEKRLQQIEQTHRRQRENWEKRVAVEGEVITPEWLTACLRKVIDDETILLDESITNTTTVAQLLPRTKPGTYYGSGGTSLGWNGGAAIGVKLAAPTKRVVNLTGDGSYLFSIPSSVYWISRKYEIPFLTVIYNNEGWNATKMNHLKLYPEGIAKETDHYWVHFDKPAELAGIAESAGDVFARKVTKPEELEEVLQQAVQEVDHGRSAVIDVRLAKISNQVD